MTLTNRETWFWFGGKWLHGTCGRHDPSSRFIAVAVDNDGPPYWQTVPVADIRFNPPQDVTP